MTKQKQNRGLTINYETKPKEFNKTILKELRIIAEKIMIAILSYRENYKDYEWAIVFDTQIEMGEIEQKLLKAMIDLMLFKDNINFNYSLRLVLNKSKQIAINNVKLY